MGKALRPEVRRALQAVKDRTASETELKLVAMTYARDHGWRRYHPGVARVGSGKLVTPQEGEAGFPDLTLVRPGRLVFAELKNEKKPSSDAQEVWMDVLRTVPGVEVYLWRPRHWETIRRTLYVPTHRRQGA